jgi:two-component system phosphate regulon response regulator PhoB
MNTALRPAFPPDPVLRRNRLERAIRQSIAYDTPATTESVSASPGAVVSRSRIRSESGPSPSSSRVPAVPRETPAGSPTASASDRPRVLVVDDEPDLVDVISINLKRNGFDVLAAGDGNTALDLTRRHRPDLVLLDLMLPGLDGTEVARRLRGEPATAGIPIVMLTAKSEETDVVVGLTLGADDYVTKPFSPKVLVARIRAVLRRHGKGSASPNSTPPPAEVLRAGPLTMDLDKHEVAVSGQAVKLTLTEFKLLRALVEARGRVMSRDRLMDKAMGADVFVTDRAIDVHVTAIRKKLGEASWIVHTVRGVGYRLQDEPPEN